MRRRVLLTVLVSILAPMAATSDNNGEPVKLSGMYNSGYQNRPRRLQAEFTATGDGQWDVAFYFEYNGADHIYDGTAEGHLDSGEFQGVVRNESRQRTFTFRGEFDDGDFDGTHSEVQGDRERETGPLTLKAVGRGG